MAITIRTLVLLLVLFAWTNNLSGQSNVLSRYQDTLLNIKAQVNTANDDEVKIASNAEFVKTLVNALKITYSYNFNFDSLKSISFLKSPDNSFRIISWHLQMADGSYRYYGAIQIATSDGKLKLYPLMDDTQNIKDNNALLSNKNWYGARYYDIVPVNTAGKAPYYVLLGWKGKNQRTTSKVIEILSFENNAPMFGKQVFDGVKGSKPQNRIVFQYSSANSMTLQRDHTVNLIVFDHLVPVDPSKKDDFEFYASDLSFDAYKILNGRLKLLEDVELKNPPSSTDELYNDPKLLAPKKGKQN